MLPLGRQRRPGLAIFTMLQEQSGQHGRHGFTLRRGGLWRAADGRPTPRGQDRRVADERPVEQTRTEYPRATRSPVRSSGAARPRRRRPRRRRRPDHCLGWSQAGATDLRKSPKGRTSCLVPRSPARAHSCQNACHDFEFAVWRSVLGIERTLDQEYNQARATVLKTVQALSQNAPDLTPGARLVHNKGPRAPAVPGLSPVRCKNGCTAA